MQKLGVILRCRKRDLDPGRSASRQKWCLLTKNRKRVLGRHRTKKRARDQEIAIEISKRRRLAGEILPGNIDRIVEQRAIACQELKGDQNRIACIQGAINFRIAARRKFENMFSTRLEAEQTAAEAQKMCKRRFKVAFGPCDRSVIAVMRTAISVGNLDNARRRR